MVLFFCLNIIRNYFCRKFSLPHSFLSKNFCQGNYILNIDGYVYSNYNLSQFGLFIFTEASNGGSDKKDSQKGSLLGGVVFLWRGGVYALSPAFKIQP